MQAAASSRSASGFTAKLSFAHAETIIPLACLLGLFGPERHQDHKAATQLAQECGTADELHQHAPECAASEIDGVNTQQSMGHSSSSSNTSNASSSAKNSSGCDVNIESSTENSMQGSRQVWVPPIPRPPLSRGWYGSMIAPYGVNIQFVLHRCTDGQVRPTSLCFVHQLQLPFDKQHASLWMALSASCMAHHMLVAQPEPSRGVLHTTQHIHHMAKTQGQLQMMHQSHLSASRHRGLY